MSGQFLFGTAHELIGTRTRPPAIAAIASYGEPVWMTSKPSRRRSRLNSADLRDRHPPAKLTLYIVPWLIATSVFLQ
jgi:hypothetical protein